MTDPQLPPPGAVPAAPQPADGQPPIAPPPYYAEQPPAYPSTPAYPSAPAYPSTPAYPSAPAYPTGAAEYPAAPPYPGAQAPGYQAAPPGAYQVPVGGYAAASGTYEVAPTPEKRSSLLGVLALIFAIAAAIVIPIIGGIVGFEIGSRLPDGLDTSEPDVLAILSPARDQVLWAEIAFWTGTVLGIAAIVAGIIAIRKKQGRGAGIAAIVVAVAGPIIFWIGIVIALSAGTASGFMP